MDHWLFKSEPETWSFDQQWARGAKGEPWTGVRNHQAANNMKAMALGDRGFFYHSGEERAVVGLVEVIRLYRADPTDETGRFGMVDVKAVARMPKPVSLASIKAEPKLAEILLVRNSRLSVMPIPRDAFVLICKMGGLEP